MGACERGENRDSNRLWVSGGGRPERLEKRSRRDRLKGKRGDVNDAEQSVDTTQNPEQYDEVRVAERGGNGSR